MKHKEELSVEEILTSIRGVINSHSLKISKGDSADEDILELTEVSEVKAENDNADSSISEKEEVMQSISDFVSRVSSIDYKNAKRIDSKNSSLEELVIRLIKPEILSWLDHNLPNIVRQIVQQEIDRLTTRKD